MRTVTLRMNDLSCPSCIKKIERTLLKQKGVKDARVLFSSGKGIVDFNEDVITKNQIATIVQKLGYPVAEVKVKSFVILSRIKGEEKGMNRKLNKVILSLAGASISLALLFHFMFWNMWENTFLIIAAVISRYPIAKTAWQGTLKRELLTNVSCSLLYYSLF